MINEAAYPGNLGMIEMFKFYQIASDTEKQQMRKLIDSKQYDKAWELLKKVTKVNLHSPTKVAALESKQQR